MLRRISILLVLFVMALPLFAPLSATHAAGSTVRISVTDDPVRINGLLMDNAHAKYPFVTYKGITYLPLTWDNAVALGIQLVWSQETGLWIYKMNDYVQGSSIGGMRPPLQQDLSAVRSLPASYNAVRSDYPITVQYQLIENSNEEYPFLEFQDITYMPLTWQFVHDLLKLTIYWDVVNGLNVIGGQRQIIGQLVWDDAQYLYSQPGIVYDDDHSMLKISKSFTDKPVWMNKREAEQVLVQAKQTRENDPYRGKSVEPDIRQDGLYYEGQQLLEASDLVYASAVSKLEFSLTRFDLKDDRYLIALEKRIIAAGRTLRTNYLYLFQAGKATFLRQQNPAKVLPNQDGSYWIASYLEFPMANTLQVSRLDSEGHLESLNEKWNELSVSMIGLGSPSPDFGEPGFPNPKPSMGIFMLYYQGFHLIGTARRTNLVSTS